MEAKAMNLKQVVRSVDRELQDVPWLVCLVVRISARVPGFDPQLQSGGDCLTLMFPSLTPKISGGKILW